MSESPDEFSNLRAALAADPDSEGFDPEAIGYWAHELAPKLLAAHDALAAENARLNEIVGRLPKTADGVPVTSGMEVWRLCTDDGPGRPCEPFIIKQYASMAVSDRASIEWDIPAGQADLCGCYSTRESALLARSQTEGMK